MFYWFMKHVVAGPLVRLLFRPNVTGLDLLPRSGAVIIASNHLSFIDSVIMPIVVPRRVHYLAASTYFRQKGPGGWALRSFLRATGMIPIDRSGGKASEASLRAGMVVLGRGDVLGIYPEGSRTRDGKLHRGRTGVARMVLESGATVVPVAMVGTDQVIPVDSKSIVPRPARVGVRLGHPLQFADVPEGPERMRVITDRIMHAIHDLGEQEYDDSYTSAAKRHTD